ncbi:hypothetical protein [uncultured Corynebacterium sp.]|uniref:hypothetical protein n=1 Tax=uncultured Corynebacterium sp. TaxID=159447 RepID=UPI0025E6E397|nr:hypothetical protein [uncultured Corynebacterium sp.]
MLDPSRVPGLRSSFGVPGSFVSSDGCGGVAGSADTVGTVGSAGATESVAQPAPA